MTTLMSGFVEKSDGVINSVNNIAIADLPPSSRSSGSTGGNGAKGTLDNDVEAANRDGDVVIPGNNCQDLPGVNCTTRVSTFKSLSFLDRFLAVWIFLSMAIGLILGYFVPSLPHALQKGNFVGVSIPIAIGLLVMMYPILCKVQYEKLHLILRDRSLWIQVAFSVVVNWIVAPLFMVALAWAFLPDESELREGLIVVGIARCIAMVLVWTNLASADLPYCAILVALNSFLQIALFAPFAMLYINVFSPSSSNIAISFSTVATSVGVFLGIPLGAAIITRLALFQLVGETAYAKFIKAISPLSLLGLLFTIIVLFACQSANIVSQVVSVCRVAAPLLVYFLVIFAGTLGFCRYMHIRHRRRSGRKDDPDSSEDWGYARSTTQALTAASNNFELAIAVAVATWGVDSKQALAATVGPLIEVPVLLGLVEVAKRVSRRWI